MAKLITHHDPFHIHKILGVFVLVHFLYRTLLVLHRGFVFCSIDNDLCTPNQTHIDAICILLHAALSWSALLMPLPAEASYTPGTATITGSPANAPTPVGTPA